MKRIDFSRHHARRALLTLAVLSGAAALGLTGCGQDTSGTQPAQTEQRPLNVYDLRLPLDALPGLARLEYKSVVLDNGEPEPNNTVLSLRGKQITSTAYYKYWMTDGKAYYKAKMSVFANARAAKKAWDGQYPAAALAGTTETGYGDASFNLGNRRIGWRDGPMMIETSPHGGAGALPAFAKAYAAQIHGVLKARGLAD